MYISFKKLKIWFKIKVKIFKVGECKLRNESYSRQSSLIGKRMKTHKKPFSSASHLKMNPGPYACCTSTLTLSYKPASFRISLFWRHSCNPLASTTQAGGIPGTLCSLFVVRLVWLVISSNRLVQSRERRLQQNGHNGSPLNLQVFFSTNMINCIP